MAAITMLVMMMMIDSAKAAADPWWHYMKHDMRQHISQLSVRLVKPPLADRSAATSFDSSGCVTMNHLPHLWSTCIRVPVLDFITQESGVKWLSAAETATDKHTCSQLNVKLLAFAFPGNCM